MPISKYTRLNEQIRAPQVRLIDAAGQQVGVVQLAEALQSAQTAGLDLVEIAPNAEPPVVKVINWGKYQYQQEKLAQKAKKKHKTQTVKQIRFGLKIGEHDLNIKLAKARQFLTQGDKVKLSLMFKGREITHKELGYQKLESIIAQFGDLAEIDEAPQLTGRFLSVSLRKKSA